MIHKLRSFLASVLSLINHIPVTHLVSCVIDSLAVRRPSLSQEGANDLATPGNKTVRANYPGGISSRREGCSPARKTDDRNLIHVCPRIALERKREIEASDTKPVRRLRDSYSEAGVPLCVASKAGISFRLFSPPRPLFVSPLSLSLVRE